MKEQKAGKQISGFNNYQKYPKYKDSGVEWLGEIPEHWEVRKMKRLGNISSGNGFPNKYQGGSDGTTPFLKVEDMNITGNEIFIKRCKNKADKEVVEKLGATIFKPSSIIFPKVGAALLTNKRRILTEPSCIDNNIMAIMPVEANYKFLYYFLSSLDLGRLANPGAVPSLNETQFRKVKGVFPSLSEQKNIVHFLDRETAKIDKLIEKKEGLIELLEEKRQAIITKAVTKGLDSDVPMKDSGVEWLDEIPEHWEIRKLKFVSQIDPEKLSESIDPDYKMKYINIGNVNSNGEILGFDNLTFEKAPTRARKVVQDGDSIISTVRAYLQEIAYMDNPCKNTIVSTGFSVLRPNQKIRPKYFYHILQSKSFIDSVMMHSKGVSYPAINSTELSNLPVWFPSQAEQKNIEKFLENQSKSIDDLIKQIKKVIEKLKEYRTALISAAVTGKIDVRDEVKSPTENTKEVQVSSSKAILFSDAGEK